ncbi:MAG: aspartate kinase [Pseudomonadota bacterium]|nr:aspartate kinase [Pseudomonadota bacterium]MDE3038155.1 aspartate kinase [Pseudomonadota bacterium]
MALIVQKFGGTSVGDIERIKNVACKVKKERDAGNRVAVVVSAMAGVTNQLVGYVEALSPLNSDEAWREYDQVVSSGEQVTSGLLALALHEMGVPSRSFAGGQIPLKTNHVHGKARIAGIDATEIKKALDGGMAAVVAGFQGTTPDGRIATLGRGGSDTSAVALAAALKADRCDIYTDVDGVYTTDPRLVEGARKLDKITCEEMLELASLGAKVLQTRSVEMAMNHGVVVQVRSSFADTPGTYLVNEEDIVEQKKITGIAYSRDEARVTLTGVPDKPGVAAAIFGPLADANINVDMIVQNVDEIGRVTDMTFTVNKTDLERAVAALQKARPVLQYKEMNADKNVAKISVVGVGMRSHAGVALDMFKTLAEKNINILVISTSEIKISVLIAEEYTELAVRALHAAFELEKA